MELTYERAELRSALTMPGALSVIICLTMRMPELSAQKWDSQTEVLCGNVALYTHKYRLCAVCIPNL